MSKVVQIMMLALSSHALLAMAQDCDIACTQEYNPICGSNGITYANLCLLNTEACKSKRIITAVSEGICETPCLEVCPMNYEPVCGTNSVTYGNLCQLSVDACKTKTQITTAYVGECIKGGEEETPCLDMCAQVYEPVCATNGITYGNLCLLTQLVCKTKTQIYVAYEGECIKTDECEIMCTEEYAPVCGSDGLTYSNLCQLQVNACKSKTPIVAVQEGECSTDDNSEKEDCTNFCTMEYIPVCGSNKKTYPNLCHLTSEACLLKSSISVSYEGECQKKEETPCPDVCPMNYEPVCGTNWITYSNECLLKQDSCLSKSEITVAHAMPCQDVSCNMKCSSALEPVCGSDEVTYTNQCLMMLTSCEQKRLITVSHEGECKRCNDICTKIYMPVCGNDLKTYPNECVLSSASCKSQEKGLAAISKLYEGTCEEVSYTNQAGSHDSNSHNFQIAIGASLAVFALAALAGVAFVYKKSHTSDPSEQTTLLPRA